MNINILYLLSGGLAIYSVEMADSNQPWHITGLIAILLVLIPTVFDAIFISGEFSLTKKQTLSDKD